MMLTILLGFFLGAALILALSLQYLERQKWMRMFSERQGIPIDIMEGKEKPAQPGAAVPHKSQRRKFAVPIPGAEWMRKEQHPS